MSDAELAVWSVMLGGLLTLAAVAFAFTLLVRSANALRYLSFVALTGLGSLMRTGLVEVLLPEIPMGVLHLVKVCAGPLSAALVIRYMSIWLGAPQADPGIHRLASWGTGAMLLAALVLAVLVFVVPDELFWRLLRASAIITAVAAAIGLAAALRAAALGDPLAGWAALAAACLTVGLYGMYAHSVRLPGHGLGTWILTVVCMLTYFLVASVVAIMRIREGRRLDRLAQLQAGADPATGLPTGSLLLADVEHAFWRARHFRNECTVVCVHVNNLYELGQVAGRGVEHQIQAAVAARIRRAAGFRCIVGLYHPRCFLVVLSTDRRQHTVDAVITRLRILAALPFSVVGRDNRRHEFVPRLGLGVVRPDLAQDSPMDVINAAERQALAPAREPAPTPEDRTTLSGLRMAETDAAPLS
jgi:GGDEF domain-containing protein